jgi:hypothetical protein
MNRAAGKKRNAKPAQTVELVRVYARIPASSKRKLEAAARAQDRSLMWYLRHIVESHLEALKHENKAA